MNIKFNRKIWVLILCTAILATALTALQIKFTGEYGFLLFLFTPLLIGVLPILLYDKDEPLKKREVITIGLVTLSLFSISLVLLGIEGLICIAMAVPIGVSLTIIGSLIAFLIRSKQKKENGLKLSMLFFLTIPLFAYMDVKSPLTLSSVKTSIIIEANIKQVWESVVTFPKLKEPNDYLFKAGVSYPIEATIDGKGKGAIRYCKFNTGDFIEPITTWNEPNELSFDVQQQPLPMKELSFYDIDAPHLHDYFLSKKGQFKLTKISENKTLLEGTTWYTHNIRPEFYWKIWSNYIIHKIHLRVLEHIKTNAERNEAA